MPLSDAEKASIREEELVRLEARDDFERRRGMPAWRVALFWVSLVLFALLFWTWLRRITG